MKKYTLGFLLVAVISLLGAILFTNSFEPIDNLMSPPMLSGDYYDIQVAFEGTAGKGYVLKYPTKGVYRSAFTFIDLTNDDDEEVVVFYSRADEIGVVRMNVLDEIEGEWVSIADFESAHSEIQQLEFADLNGDGKIEIITGWATYQSDMSKKLNIYEINISQENSIGIKNVFEDDYSEFYIFDVDNNGSEDILSLKYRTKGPETEYIAAFLRFGNLGVYEEGTISLDKSISTVKSSVSEKSGSFRRIYIDGYKIDSGMVTDCFYWNSDEKAFVRITIEGQPLTSLTSRSTNIVSADIDGDRKIEVPVEEMLPASSVIVPDREIHAEQALIRWTNITDESLTTDKYQIVNQTGGYSFNFDADWLGKVTVKNSTAEDTLSFYELKLENGQFVSGKPLFSIRVMDTSADEDNSLTYYKFLGVNKGKYYYYRIYSGGEDMEIDRKTIAERIDYS